MWRQACDGATVGPVTDAIVITDEAGVIQSVNPSTERILGHDAGELRGRNVELLMPADQAWQAATAAGTARGPNGATQSFIGRRKDGRLIPLERSVTEWLSDDGRRYFTWSLRDTAVDRAAVAALRENQEWMRTLSDTALAGLVVIDPQHKVRFANRAYAVLFNLVSHDLAGFHLREILPEIYDSVLRGRLDATFAGARRSYQTVYPVGGDPARRRHLAETYEPSRSAAGDQLAVVVISDVTELKHNEAALRSSRDLLQSVLDGALDAIFAKDAAGRYVVVNESGARLIGQSREAILGRDDQALFDAEAAKLFAAQDRHVMRSGTPCIVEQALLRDGEPIDVLLTKRPWAGPDGASGGVVGIIRDVTEQRLIAAERQDIAKRLMRAQETERLRIARELHDQVGQDLTGLALGLKGLEADLQTPDALARLAWLREMTDQISRNLHRTARELRPTSLEDLGLRDAITSHVTEWSARFGLQADVLLDDLNLANLGSDAELAIYRCMQEALTNILKHAKATSISVIAQRTPNELRVIVEDNGIGFNPEEPPPRKAEGGLGLIGMRERLSHVGGTVAIESAPGRGTSVFLSLAIA